MIGERALRGSEVLNAGEFDRFVRAYLDYCKIPGLSVAVIKDSKVAYHNGFGVRNAATKEPVTDNTVFEAASMTKPVSLTSSSGSSIAASSSSTRRFILISPIKTSHMMTATS